MAAFEAWLVLLLVVNVVGELQQKRTLAASRGFLAAARLSCLSSYLTSSPGSWSICPDPINRGYDYVPSLSRMEKGHILGMVTSTHIRSFRWRRRH